MNEYLKFALKLAKEAGKEIAKNFDLQKSIEFKSVKNPVTTIDRHIEKVITKSINKAYPSHKILAEEFNNKLTKSTKKSSSKKSDDEFLWIIDPIDGTKNFIHGIPFVAVSIALQMNGEIIAGVVHAPILNQTFYSAKNSASYLNGKKITVSKAKKLENALITTGMQPIFHEKEITYYTNFCKKAGAVRRLGSAALDLCYIACGKLDGCFETALKPWDIAAGILILKNAGGKTTSFKGKPLNYLKDGNVLSSNTLLHPQMLKTIDSAKI
ncbi:MAG: inositol-1-monophosphatase, myo-inositol-1(or 4)-monophosphatase [Candidatus Peregrinibacteria bacterium GW2011_GWF2_38_29]|nr:MAG: inositol-1-monophosphatase, myo-inositol-1(or 4)-monophosphatase [Candidatus Peregrinibacteria bacterium GW2011_GWF2_38_29]HBB03117.1 inositol monophosphatase [Candidatus Peregrinibacteria bacterium]